MNRHSVTVSQLFRRGPAEIFDAFADPDTLCRFWLDAASGPLTPGASVEWRFKVPGVRDTVTVSDFQRPRRLGLRFSDGTELVLDFEFHGGDATRVVAVVTGSFGGDVLVEATSMVEGFAIVLCDLKTLLETGRSASLVRDKAELIARQRVLQV